MSKEHLATNRGQFYAVVSFNRRIGDRFYRLGLDLSGAGAKAFAGAGPGQFAQLDVCGTALPQAKHIPKDLVDTSRREILLRRPFSFADVISKDNETLVDILYRVTGPSSLRMTTLAPGNKISIIGPLGNGFSVPKEKKTALLVCGGIGAGPLLHLAKYLTDERADIRVIAFVGAKNVKKLPFERRLDEISTRLGFSIAEFGKYGIESMVATDDGSAGFKGFVTDCLLEWLEQNHPAEQDAVIYGCGPEVMLAKTATIAKENKMDCQVSMERMMACGIGVCQSCVVECKTGTLEKSVYKLCCEYGPVFDSKEVVFNI